MTETSTRPRVLIVDDEHLLRWGLVKQFQSAGFHALGLGSAEEALHALAEEPARVVLLDYRLPQMDGIECLRKIRADHPSTIVIMMTGHGSISSAVEAMRLGAHNYVTKPFDSRSVLSMVQSLVTASNGRPASSHGTPPRKNPLPEAMTPREQRGLDRLIGSSRAMAQIRSLIGKVAKSPARTVLITGESGTGKDYVAETLHYISPRSSRPFIHVDVGSLTPSLFESELFGHEKGAFTDAHTTKPGLLELAEGGTLFLDEIGDLDPKLQTKLLHFVEHRSLQRVGGVKRIHADVRLIAATNANLQERVSSGQFRQDLYFRLRVIPIHLPPLHQREHDVLELANHMLARFNESFGRSFRGLTEEAQRMLEQHHWIGNVREVRNVIERAVILDDGEWITPDLIVFDDPLSSGSPLESQVPVPGYSTSLEEMERKVIANALERTRGNQVRAAELLGLGRDALRYRMKKYGLVN